MFYKIMIDNAKDACFLGKIVKMYKKSKFFQKLEFCEVQFKYQYGCFRPVGYISQFFKYLFFDKSFCKLTKLVDLKVESSMIVSYFTFIFL